MTSHTVFDDTVVHDCNTTGTPSSIRIQGFLGVICPWTWVHLLENEIVTHGLKFKSNLDIALCVRLSHWILHILKWLLSNLFDQVKKYYSDRLWTVRKNLTLAGSEIVNIKIQHILSSRIATVPSLQHTFGMDFIEINWNPCHICVV